MTTLVLTHPDCLAHDTGAFHPESPERLRVVLEALAREEFIGLEFRDAPLAPETLLRLAHSPAHVQRVLSRIPESGRHSLDADTVVSPGSGRAARRAAGAVIAAVDAVLAGECRNAFCAVRPPGHHAELRFAMGFCLFNSVVIGARHALDRGLERVAVLDFDVHHGNGSQDIVWDDARIFYGSTHESPLFPGTGSPDDRGAGNIHNVPLAAGAGSAEFRAAWSEKLLPRVREFQPQLVLVSAGFDGHYRDPLAALELETRDYHWLTRELLGLARDCAEGRLVSALEGGYNLEALVECTRAHVRALMDDNDS